LGDAAHPILPFMAQGSCMALEDAAVLTSVLNDTNNINNALRKYEKIRKKRVTDIQKISSKNGKVFHLSNLILRKLLQINLRLLAKVYPSFLNKRFNWIYRYKV
jgi:salicylate hydroxylase